MTYEPSTTLPNRLSSERWQSNVTQDVARDDVTIVVPVFNERECVQNLVDALCSLETAHSDRYQFEFVLVDDGSTDGTATLLRDMLRDKPEYRVVPHAENRGIAAAIHTGIRHANSEIVVSIDADGSYDAGLIEQMLPLLTDEVDLVTASPYHPNGAVENVPYWRLWLSRRASGLYRLLLNTQLHCYTACFRAYRRSKVVDLEPSNKGYVGVAELLWNVDRSGGRIVECPAILRTRVAGYSKMKVVKEAKNHLKLLTKIGRKKIARQNYRSPADLTN